jgi:HSP20 family molecular chaperone IbpA
MTESTVPTTTQEESAVPATRDTTRYIVPPVDIYETQEGLVVVADLPGVDGKDVDIRVENNVLTIHGKSQTCDCGDRFHTEFGLADFYRQFQLNQEVDQSRITAETKHGVLTVNLQKQEAAKPRKIEVQLG